MRRYPRQPLPARPNVLYVDCPWQYTGSKKTGGSMTSGSVAQYAVLTMAELTLMALEFQHHILAREAVVALWATVAMKDDALEILANFGMTYKATFYWEKIYPGRQMGLGAWNRGGVEELLIGTRGKVPAWRLQQPAIVRHPVLSHSRKPAVFRDIITTCTAKTMPDPVRVELFARRPAQGWTSTGLEFDGRDIRKAVMTWPGHIPTSV